jgi:hypothetical protein
LGAEAAGGTVAGAAGLAGTRLLIWQDSMVIASTATTIEKVTFLFILFLHFFCCLDLQPAG